MNGLSWRIKDLKTNKVTEIPMIDENTLNKLGYYKKPNQSKYGSFFESVLAALVAAPSAMLLHWYMLELWGNNLGDEQLKQLFVTVSWLSFFFHSIVWKFILRRIFDRYGFKLEPTFIFAKLRGRL